ncbi:MAG: ABC transporter substrate-binding protein [Candidatus Hadarchaeum sp.]|uniref:ABC transporter substrate-binding protein n=1 Tax=Candidatus Hadarchaeum sp. TaxID=2883567 RepID=UPI00317CA539
MRFVLAVLGLFGVVAFGQPIEGGRLVWALYEEPPTLDPVGSTLAVQHMINDHIFEHLCVFDNNGRLQPHLCTDWTVSADGLIWDVALKPGITFHNGKEVTAEDWVYSLERTRTIGPRKGFYEPVLQYVAADRYTLRIVLKRPFPRILEILTLPDAYLVDRETVEAKGDQFGITPPLNGTGPYELKEWRRGEYVLLERVLTYNHGPSWRSNQGPAYVNEVQFRFIRDDNTRVFELIQGNVDITSFIPSSLYDVVLKAANITFVERVRNMTGHLAINTKHEPLNDILVRHAIAMAIEREPLVEVAYRGHGQPAYILCSPSQLGFPTNYEEVRAYYPKTNTELAKAYLKAAGWSDVDGDGVVEKDGKELRLAFWTQLDTESKLMGQIIQQQLARVGIATEITSIETGTFYGALVTQGRHDLALGMSGYPFAMDFLPFQHHTRSIGGSNYSNYDYELAPVIDALLDLAQILPTEDARYEALAEALKFIGTASVYIPLVWPMYPLAWKTNRVGGVEKVLEHAFKTQVDSIPLDCLEYYIKR